MGYYEILSIEPHNGMPEHYRGLYRLPAPYPEEDEDLVPLWERYTQNADKSPGITTELTLEELHRLARGSGEAYEVVYFSRQKDCPYPTRYYGVDVTGFGGYSMLGEGLFTNRKSPDNTVYHIVQVLNESFGRRLNEYGLFSSQEDAECFLGVLKEWNLHFPDHIEQEDWRIAHVFKIL